VELRDDYKKMTLSMMLDRYAVIHTELKCELERFVSFKCSQLRAELWSLKLAIIERCEGMDVDPQVYLSEAINGTLEPSERKHFETF